MKKVMQTMGALAFATSFCLLHAGVTLAAESEARAQASAPAKQAAALPVYKPPLRGAPAAGRLIGGGSRGSVPNSLVLAVLAPEHTGLTSSAQPTLHFYISEPARALLEITVLEAGAVHPAAEIALGTVHDGGLVAVDLARHGVTLKPDTEYAWSVAVVPEPEQRSHDIISSGVIKRTPASPELTAKLSRAAPDELAFVYAEEGYWYDAVTAVSALIQSRPQDKALRAQRAALLEQVALQEIARHETELSAR